MPGPPCTPIKGRMQANHTLLNRLSKTIVLIIQGMLQPDQLRLLREGDGLYCSKLAFANQFT